MFKSIFNSVVAVSSCFMLFSCGGGTKPSELAGQWVYESGVRNVKDLGRVPEQIELFKDGTGVVEGNSISWKVENNRLVFLSSQLGFACNYKLSGYALTFIDENGDSATFVRKGRLEEFKAKQAADAEKAERAAVAEAERNERIVSSEKSVFIKGYGMVQESIEETYSNGAKKKVNGFVGNKGNVVRTTFFFEDGKMQSDRFFKNGEPDSTMTFYNADGSISQQTGYSKGQKHGSEKSWYPGGQLKSEAEYVNGAPVGRAVSYFEDGKTAMEVAFKDGKKDGEEIEYYSNGQKKRVRTYKLGDQDGPEIEYYQNGNLKSEHIYVKNVLNGPFKMYNEKTGKMVESGEY